VTLENGTIVPNCDDPGQALRQLRRAICLNRIHGRAYLACEISVGHVKTKISDPFDQVSLHRHTTETIIDPL
jgi:hypothetical protein